MPDPVATVMGYARFDEEEVIRMHPFSLRLGSTEVKADVRNAGTTGILPSGSDVVTVAVT